MDLIFEGFKSEAFETLGRLQAEPFIDRYRTEKEALKRWVQDPFKRYRDELVVHWVLPRQLPLETERNVFSRILKNDFGAGGSHSHLWLAFYHRHRKRLRDVQLAHAIFPDRFTVGLYVGDGARPLLKAVKDQAVRAPRDFLANVNERVQDGYFFFYYLRGHTRPVRLDTPLTVLPDALAHAVGLGVRKEFGRAQVIDWGPALVEHTLLEVRALWPLYKDWAQWEQLNTQEPT